MYATIIVGTDGSETAAEAVKRAAEVAKLSGAQLHIVTAFNGSSSHESPGPDGDSDWLATAGVRAEVLLRQAVARIDESDLDVEQHAPVGDPPDVIIDLALELHADLIVVGSKGMTGVARFLLGSVPNKIAHHAPCDVLIARTV